MSKGKQKGFKKKQIEIRDESMAPYYLLKDDRQYVKMMEGNSLPLGYFTNLANALASVSKDVQLSQDAGKIFSLKRFLDRTEEVNNQILNSINE
tara:strand:+ start:1415 stop:1696 length:282 start_codon:yes stop_codon:yes gene_type:complete